MGVAGQVGDLPDLVMPRVGVSVAGSIVVAPEAAVDAARSSPAAGSGVRRPSKSSFRVRLPHRHARLAGAATPVWTARARRHQERVEPATDRCRR